MPKRAQPAFLKKPLKQLTTDEWESLCDGCGLCCQIRVIDEETEQEALSNAACRLLNLTTHRCSDYANRKSRVSDCVKITPHNVHTLTWLPSTCAYRLAAQHYPLPDWHHLICEDPNRVHTHGPSMRGELLSEDDTDWEALGIEPDNPD